MKKTLAPEECLACVLHSRKSLKEVMPKLLKELYKKLEDAIAEDNQEWVDALRDEFNKTLSDLNIRETEDLDGELADGMWDVYYDKNEDWYYTQEIK